MRVVRCKRRTVPAVTDVAGWPSASHGRAGGGQLELDSRCKAQRIEHRLAEPVTLQGQRDDRAPLRAHGRCAHGSLIQQRRRRAAYLAGLCGAMQSPIHKPVWRWMLAAARLNKPTPEDILRAAIAHCIHLVLNCLAFGTESLDVGLGPLSKVPE